MRRRVMKILTLVSAIICVGSLLLVGRSFVVFDFVGAPFGQRDLCGAGTIDGQLILLHERRPVQFYYFNQSARSQRREMEPVWQNLNGVRWLGVGWGSAFGEDFLILPLWLVPMVTAILPVRWWVRRRREGRRGFEVQAV